MKKLTIRERVKITTRGWSILNKYCPGLAQGKALSALVVSLQPFVSIWFSAQIINEISSQRRINMLILYVCFVVLINLATSVLRNIIDKITSEKESQMWSFFRKIFTDKQMSMDYVDIENAEIQHQRKKAEENLFMFANGLGQLVWGITGLVTALTTVIVSVLMTVTLFTQATGNRVMDSPLWIALLFVCILLGGRCSSKANSKENEILEEWSNGTVWFNRAFSFFGRDLYMNPERAKDVRMYEQNLIADCVLKRLLQHNVEDDNHIFKMSMCSLLAGFVTDIFNALCYLFVVLKAFFGAFGVGSIVQYVGVLTRLGTGIQDIMFVLTDNGVYCSHLQGLFEFLDIPNKKYQGTLPIEKRAFCDGGDNDYEIEFRDVSFRYHESDEYALRHVSMKIRIGERLAVVGMNGSGKTTFIKLLCRLYDPTEGEILLNGIDIKKYDYDEYMSIFSVVFQDFKLFSFSLAQNVAVSMDYDKSQVKDCLKEAGFGTRLAEMPSGVETYMYKDFEEKGVEVSGGEAQKIALARALYKDAPFMILDEPTAALDPIAEYEIYSKFNKIIASKTAIYISHRLSSCRFCDDIVVFDKGQIVQRGSHGELVGEEQGKYYELWYAQAQYYA
ncbi:ABC transporter ATP-binding protein [Anaerosporobacter sp.]|uniref:ABC transporter ATP-binding protein n=1 Tax=Anaerosporobacter sp. TaxID=1872529 RepID=UPI00286F8851|nr:ABC transporter ATP-binding protein [Anaerosporobacter sp.]